MFCCRSEVTKCNEIECMRVHAPTFAKKGMNEREKRQLFSRKKTTKTFENMSVFFQESDGEKRRRDGSPQSPDPMYRGVCRLQGEHGNQQNEELEKATSARVGSQMKTEVVSIGEQDHKKVDHMTDGECQPGARHAEERIAQSHGGDEGHGIAGLYQQIESAARVSQTQIGDGGADGFEQKIGSRGFDHGNCGREIARIEHAHHRGRQKTEQREQWRGELHEYIDLPVDGHVLQGGVGRCRR